MVSWNTIWSRDTTFSKNYERRFKDSNIFEKIFINIVNQAIKYKLVDGTTFYTDSTHKKANANKNKFEDKHIKISTTDKKSEEVLIYDGLIDKNEYKQYKSYNKTIIIRIHIKENWNDIFRTNKLSDKGKELYQRRKEHIERSFADSKQNYGYRYVMYKGLKKNQNYTWLICAAQNMKNISIKKSKTTKSNQKLSDILKNIVNKLKIIFNF